MGVITKKNKKNKDPTRNMLRIDPSPPAEDVNTLLTFSSLKSKLTACF